MSCCNCNKSDLSLINEVLEKYADVDGSLITILQHAQDIYGYLPTDVLYHIAEKIGSTPAKVMGVATFYSQFRLQPVGKYLIMLCQGTACHVNGSEKIEKAIKDEIGISDGGDPGSPDLLSQRGINDAGKDCKFVGILLWCTPCCEDGSPDA